MAIKFFIFLSLHVCRVGLLMSLFLLSAWSQTSIATQRQVGAKDLIQAFQHEMDRLRKENGIPGMSVAVLQKQQIVFVQITI